MKRLYKANNGTAPGATKGTLDAITDFKEWVERLLLLEQDLQVSRAGWVSHVIKAANTLRDSSAVNIDTPPLFPLLHQTPPTPHLSNHSLMMRRHSSDSILDVTSVVCFMQVTSDETAPTHILLSRIASR